MKEIFISRVKITEAKIILGEARAPSSCREHWDRVQERGMLGRMFQLVCCPILAERDMAEEHSLNELPLLLTW